MYSGFKEKALELIQKGYWITTAKPGLKYPGRNEWEKDRLDADSAERFLDKEGYGVCIMTGIVCKDSDYSVIAVDMDIMDAYTVDQLNDWCEENIGPSPVKIGRAPKATRFYKYKGARRKSQSGKSADNKGEKIEYLGEGNQTVAYHIHPDTGVPYQWTGDLPNVEDLAEINDVLIDSLNEFLYEIRPEFKPVKKAGNFDHKNTNSEASSWQQKLIEIYSSGNFHQGLVDISWGMVRDGCAPNFVITMLQSLMLSIPEKDDRWQSRYDDIPRIVLGAFDSNEVNFDDIVIEEEVEVEKIEMPWPPGLLGELCEDIYYSMRFQHKEVAIMTALSMIAGIAGRQFNITDRALNVYIVILAEQSMGKSFLGDYIRTTLAKLFPLGTNSNISSFCSGAQPTGPKALHSSLKKARCQLIIKNEAGFLKRSKVGAKDDLASYELNLYGWSAKITPEFAYSSSEDTLEPLMAPCLSMLSESTPKVYLEAIKQDDGIITGDIARHTIVRISSKKPYPNRAHYKKEMRSAVGERLREIIKYCAPFQDGTNYCPVQITPFDEIMDADMERLECHLVDLHNNTSLNTLEKAMTHRGYEKAIKFAGIASVFNHFTKIEPKIGQEEWEWAKKMQDYEMKTVNNFFIGGTFGDIRDEIVRTKVGPAILKLLSGKYRSIHDGVTDNEKRMGIFTRYSITQAMRRCTEVIELNDNPARVSKPQNGITKILDYMVEAGYIEPIMLRNHDGRSARSKKFKVTSQFRVIFEI